MAESAEILTTRLRILPFSEAYLTPEYVDWLNDPEVVRYSEQRHRAHTLASCRAYCESFRGSPHYFWAIVERELGLGHIGNMTAYVNAHNRVADLGILIGNRDAWRKGYASEAWAIVCDYLFEHADMRKISAGTLAANIGMLAVMRATGMVDDGRRSRHSLLDGSETDVIHAAVFKGDWRRGAG